jgi:hypothetical protein
MDSEGCRRIIRYLPLGIVVLLGVVACCLAVFVSGALAVGDATTAPGESCPNEASSGFRAFLPECRAFEMVTPVFKDGAELELLDLSGGGTTVLAETLGALAGTESDSELHGSAYELTRSDSGWSVSAVSPPASMFPAQQLLGASPELATTLWLGRGPSESIAAENLYIRNASGTMVTIGSMLPPSAVGGPPSGEFEGFLWLGEVKYRDASDDLSHVLFTIEKPDELGLAWPGDTTEGKESLYEYSGIAKGRPELVGVNDAGKLISTCSTYLGSVQSDDIYNAVSANGASVFFTAMAPSECGGSTEGPEVNELYGRIDGFETVAISEPSTQQCAACTTGVKAPAEFAGASENGQKVFFLSEQELLPGATGMNLYEYNFDAPAGAHVIRVSGGAAEVAGVARVSEDGSHVYFVAAGRLTRGPRGGKNGPCLTELASGEMAEEVIAEEEEAKAEPVTTGARCRPTEGGDNLYAFEQDAVHPAGQVSFVATLSPSDATDWSGSDLRRVQTTADGRFLVFRSAADLTTGATSGRAQLFEYDALTGELVRVSRGSDGDELRGTESANTHSAEVPIQGYKARTSPGQTNTGLIVSGDGATVVFGDAGALTEEAIEGVGSGYEYHSAVASGGTISDGNVYLISDGGGVVDEGVKDIEGLDPSGEDVFFVTPASLVPSDSDTEFDTYDARRGGGFLATDPPAECVAEACGDAYVSPLLATEGNTPVAGGGGTAAPPVPVAPITAGSPKRAPGALSRAQLLARAVRACARMHHRSRRAACEAAALKRYARHRKGKKSSGGRK